MRLKKLALLCTACARGMKPVLHRLFTKKVDVVENELEGRSASRNPHRFLESHPSQTKIPCLFQQAFLQFFFYLEQRWRTSGTREVTLLQVDLSAERLLEQVTQQAWRPRGELTETRSPLQPLTTGWCLARWGVGLLHAFVASWPWIRVPQMLISASSVTDYFFDRNGILILWYRQHTTRHKIHNPSPNTSPKLGIDVLVYIHLHSVLYLVGIITSLGLLCCPDEVCGHLLGCPLKIVRSKYYCSTYK